MDEGQVEGDLAIVIFNTDNLSTDIFDHRILLYRNSLLRILDHRNFIHKIPFVKIPVMKMSGVEMTNG